MSLSEKVSFPGYDGDKLAARLDLPTGKPKAYALFAHCFSCSKDILAATRVSRRLTEHGIAVLRFDFTGLGASQGDFSNTNFSSNVQDLVAGANWLKETYGSSDLLIGHSLGGAASVVAATHLPDVKAVVTIGAPSDASHVLHQMSKEDLDQISSCGRAEVSLAGRSFTIRKQFVDDVKDSRVKDAAARLRRPLLVLHSPIDAVVGIENATGLFVAAKHPKSFVSLDDADHLLTSEEDAIYAADVLSAWAEPFISAPDEKDFHPDPPSTGYDVRVAETGTGNYAQHVVTRSHLLRADEPIDHNGQDTGPPPYDYLCAALGACTSMTIRMYADRKEWPVDHVSVDVGHEKIAIPDAPDTKVDRFFKKIRIKGDLSAEQLDRLYQISARCPVHKTLLGSSIIESEMAG